MQKSQVSFRFFFLLIFSFSLLGCYRMPTEDDFSVVPSTNNPDVTREKQGNFMPTMGF